MGDFGLNLYWQNISFFLIYFYTDAVGIPATTAGLIFMGATIFEACIDPIAGAFMDKFQTGWGRYRPWVLVGSVPLGTAFALLYWQPRAYGILLTTVLVVKQLLFRLFYTVVAVPFSALTAQMTDRSEERTTLAGLRMLFAMAAAALVAYCTQPLAELLGGGDARRGAFGAALAIAAPATVLFVVVFFAATEAVPREAQPPVRLADYFRGVLGNRAFITLVVGLLFASASATSVSRVAIYYFKYIVGQESLTRSALVISSGAAFLTVPVWTAVGRWMGKRNMWLLSLGVGLYTLILFIALRPTTPSGATAFFASMQVSNIGVSVAYWSMLPDTVEYGMWRTGIQQESFLFGLFSFFQKLGLGVSAGIFGWTLDVIGYLPGEHQAPRTIVGIGYMIAALCSVGLVGSAVATYFSPLKVGVHELLVERLSSRRLGSVEPTGAVSVRGVDSF